MKHIIRSGIMILIVILLIGVFSVIEHFRSAADVYSALEMKNDPILRMRNTIETEYPELREFEKQESFAGKSVEHEEIEGDNYFIYMTHGSGLPIAEAICFRVDRTGRPFMVGTFPDPLDSYAGYPKIDPMTCKGIREEYRI